MGIELSTTICYIFEVLDEKGFIIQKDELIQFHAFLSQLRVHMQDIKGNNNSDVFTMYDSMNISPHQIHKSREQHQKAVFELCKCLVKLINAD